MISVAVLYLSGNQDSKPFKTNTQKQTGSQRSSLGTTSVIEYVPCKKYLLKTDQGLLHQLQIQGSEV